MKKLTKKQRREIYLKAAEYKYIQPINGICFAISETIGSGKLGENYELITSIFPELLLFIDESVFKNGLNAFDSDMQMERVIILCWCAEMCNP